MESLYLLIPLSVLVVFGIVLLFAWSLNSGQFDDLEHQGRAILEEDRDEVPGPDAAADGDPDRPGAGAGEGAPAADPPVDDAHRRDRPGNAEDGQGRADRGPTAR